MDKKGQKSSEKVKKAFFNILYIISFKNLKEHLTQMKELENGVLAQKVALLAVDKSAIHYVIFCDI